MDIICVGDAMVDAFLTIEEASLHCRLNQKDCELCVRYGEKIPVETCCFLLGGIACNVAVSVSRLGFQSALVGEIGDDEFSEKIIRGLSQEGVDTAYLQQTTGTSASFTIGINFKGERTLFVEHVVRTHDFPFEGMTAPWVFLGGLGREWESAYQRTVAFVKQSGAKLAFTPGSQQFEEGVGRFIDVVNVSQALFINLDEAVKMSNVPPLADQTSNVRGNVQSIKQLLETLQAMGPMIVSITDGKNGSFALDEEGRMFQLDILAAPVVQKTGAGDAYTAGFLAALASGQPVSEAMRWGAINAASVVGKIGAQEGLLDKETLAIRLEHYPEFVAERV